MATGEGKTLTTLLPAYLNALKSRTVIITVNDYLATRDYEINSQVLAFLNISTGLVTSSSTLEEKQQAYKKDVVYTTNSEVGFDYLRDNLALSPEFLRYIILVTFDSAFADHLTLMERLVESVTLKGYRGLDPKLEYSCSFELFKGPWTPASETRFTRCLISRAGQRRCSKATLLDFIIRRFFLSLVKLGSAGDESSGRARAAAP